MRKPESIGALLFFVFGWLVLAAIFYLTAPSPFDALVPGFFVPAALVLVFVGYRLHLLWLAGFPGAAAAYALGQYLGAAPA